MQFIAIILLILAQLAHVVPVISIPLLSSPSPGTVFQGYNNNSFGNPHKAMIDIVADLDRLTTRAHVLANNTHLVARGTEFHAAGLLDSLSGLPVIGGLLPIVAGLLKTVEGLLPLESIPIVGPLLGALDENGNINGTVSAPMPTQTLDPIAEAARLTAASDLLRAAATELNKAVRIADALAAKEVASDGSLASTTTATDAAPTPAAARAQEFSFSGRVGST